MTQLQLEEMQEVTITDSPAIDDDLARYFTPEEGAQSARDPITWDDVRQALSKISGSLSDAVIAQTARALIAKLFSGHECPG